MSKNATTSLFDKELQDAIDGNLSENHIFSLGVPGEILQKCGFPKGQRIEMSLSRLKFKASLSRHPFELNDIFGMENALQNPVGVFEYGDRTKSQNVVVNIKKGEKNFLAGIHFNQVKNNFDISTIRTLYPKDNMEWLNWIAQGKMVYGNKKELQALTAQQRMNVADVNGQVVQSPLHEHCLKSIENILSKFGTVNDIFTDEYPFYKDVKLHGEIEKRFFTYYTSKGNLDTRELATVEADEFYAALKNNDQKKLNEYMQEEFHEVNEIAAEILSEYSKEKSMEQKELSKELTKIVLRIAIADSEVQAYFPDSVEFNRSTGNTVMTGYAHEGQHFEAEIDYIKNETRPLMDSQQLRKKKDKDNLYLAISDGVKLTNELKMIGYKNLKGSYEFDWNEIKQKLNKKEKSMENTKKEITAKELQNYIESLKIRHPSKWAEAVKEDAADLVGNYIEWNGEDAPFKAENVEDLLNGATDWRQYSQGGLGLIYDEDIARHYCNTTELKKVGFKEVNGVLKEPLRSELKNPNPKENWLDVQGRALFQASELVKKSVRDMEMKREQNVEKKSPSKTKAKLKDDDFGMGR